MDKTRHWQIVGCSAYTGEGLLEGFDWLVQDVASRIYVLDYCLLGSHFFFFDNTKAFMEAKMDLFLGSQAYFLFNERSYLCLMDSLPEIVILLLLLLLLLLFLFFLFFFFLIDPSHHSMHETNFQM